MSKVCGMCGEDFKNARALAGHKANCGAEDNYPWRSEETLRDLYINKGLSTREVGKELGTSGRTITEWLHRHNIKTRAKGRYKQDHTLLTQNSYEIIHEDSTDNGDITKHHRLLAVAKYGFDSVSDKVVHHRNGVKWDNRPDNIELLTEEEHSRLHMEAGDFESVVSATGMKELSSQDRMEIKRKYNNTDLSQRQIAEKYGITQSGVSRICNRSE